MAHQRLIGLVVLAASVFVLAVGCTGLAQMPHSVAEQYLFQAANQERAVRGLPALQWDDALYRAAWLHAREMTSRASISHQYAGEQELSERAQAAGVHFSVVAENVAEAPTALLIHRGWMASEHHRDNLLDPRLDRIAISVLRRGEQLYAVEDFDREVVPLTFGEQEHAVATLISSFGGLQVVSATEEARKTCTLDTGFSGSRKPWFVVRFTASNLDVLPEVLRARLATGKYREVQVGACALKNSANFSGYSIAVLLFP